MTTHFASTNRTGAGLTGVLFLDGMNCG